MSILLTTIIMSVLRIFSANRKTAWNVTPLLIMYKNNTKHLKAAYLLQPRNNNFNVYKMMTKNKNHRMLLRPKPSLGARIVHCLSFYLRISRMILPTNVLWVERELMFLPSLEIIIRHLYFFYKHYFRSF